MDSADFYESRLFQLFQFFRINSANFGPKQTPKTPNKTPGARRIPHFPQADFSLLIGVRQQQITSVQPIITGS